MPCRLWSEANWCCNLALRPYFTPSRLSYAKLIVVELYGQSLCCSLDRIPLVLPALSVDSLQNSWFQVGFSPVDRSHWVFPSQVVAFILRQASAARPLSDRAANWIAMAKHEAAAVISYCHSSWVFRDVLTACTHLQAPSLQHSTSFAPQSLINLYRPDSDSGLLRMMVYYALVKCLRPCCIAYWCSYQSDMPFRCRKPSCG